MFNRRIWSSLGWALSKVRYLRTPNPYAEFRRLSDHDALLAGPPASEEPVLVLPIRVAPTSNLLEGLIGAGLKLDGHRVFALLDGGSLRYSENSSLGKSWIVANALSCYEQKEFCDVFGLEACYFDDFLDQRHLKEIVAALPRSDFAQLKAYEFEGVRIGFHARSALMRYLRQETVEIDENIALMREFVVTGLKTALVLGEFLKRHPVRYAFLSHGIYATWGVAADVLVRAGVTVSVWGRGYVGADFILGRNKSYLLQGIQDTMEEISQSAVGDEIDSDKVKRYFLEKANPKNNVDLISYYDERHEGDVDKAKWLADLKVGYEAVIAVFPNIPWDGAIFCGSDYTPTLRAFAGKIVIVAQAFPTVRLVIRCHPAEVERAGNVTRESFAAFFSAETLSKHRNICILEPLSKVSSYDLIPACDSVLVFGTTMSLELAVRSVPVIQTGFFNLSNKNIVFEAHDDKRLLEYVESTRSGSLTMSDEMKGNALRYADYYLNRLHIKDDMIETKYYQFCGFKFRSVLALRGTGLKSCFAIKDFVLGKTQRCINPYV